MCQAIRNYLVDIEGIIRIRPTYVPNKLRTNDIAIMDILLDHQDSFTEIQMKQINSCRMFLGVTYLSKVCNINWTHLVDGICDGILSNLQCSPLDDKIYQPCPKTQSWVYWEKLLQFVTVSTGSTELCSYLGDFNSNHSIRHQWKSYRNSRRAYIFDNENSSWHQYNISHSNRIQSIEESITTIPYASYTPIEIATTSSDQLISAIIATGEVSTSKLKQPFIGPEGDWDKYKSNQPKWIRRRL